MIDNEHYNLMPWNMRVKMIKENMLARFQEKFDTFYNDPEFGFKGDNKLITMIIASL